MTSFLATPKTPIFRDYTIPELVELTGYKESYLEAVKRGDSPCREGFRYTCMAKLGKSEQELFGKVL